MPYWISGSTTVFDDTLMSHRKRKASTIETIGLNTKQVDAFRQGVEINTIDKFYVGTQPKVWGGTIKFDGTVSHLAEKQTYGQSETFASFFQISQFDDKIRNFDVTSYIENNVDYPYPILTNNGPQQEQECSVEPLTIPYKKQSNESFAYYAHGVHSFFENGQEDMFCKGTAKISNFISLTIPSGCKKFLDSGEQRFGNSFTGSVVIPGEVSTFTAPSIPFTDQEGEYIVKELTEQIDSDFSIALLSLDGYKTSNTILPYNHKSATSGRDVYGPRQAKLGTDSIAFSGRIRGT